MVTFVWGSRDKLRILLEIEKRTHAQLLKPTGFLVFFTHSTHTHSTDQFSVTFPSLDARGPLARWATVWLMSFRLTCPPRRTQTEACRRRWRLQSRVKGITTIPCARTHTHIRYPWGQKLFSCCLTMLPFGWSNAGNGINRNIIFQLHHIPSSFFTRMGVPAAELACNKTLKFIGKNNATFTQGDRV